MDWGVLPKWVITSDFYIHFNDLLFQGWNSWNYFNLNISETLVQRTTDALIATGLAKLGYNYGVFFHSH